MPMPETTGQRFRELPGSAGGGAVDPSADARYLRKAGDDATGLIRFVRAGSAGVALLVIAGSVASVLGSLDGGSAESVSIPSLTTTYVGPGTATTLEQAILDLLGDDDSDSGRFLPKKNNATWNPQRDLFTFRWRGGVASQDALFQAKTGRLKLGPSTSTLARFTVDDSAGSSTTIRRAAEVRFGTLNDVSSAHGMVIKGTLGATSPTTGTLVLHNEGAAGRQARLIFSDALGPSAPAAVGAAMNGPAASDGGYLALSAHNGSALTEAARITKDGRLGVGTSSPNALLDVRGSAIFNEAGGDFDLRIEGVAQPNLFFSDGSTARIGIGTAAPGSTLGVLGTLSVGSASYAQTAASGSGAIIEGRVGIGTTTPGAALHVAHASGIRITDGGEITQPNDIYASAAVLTFTTKGAHRFVLDLDNSNSASDNFEVYHFNTAGTPGFTVFSSMTANALGLTVGSGYRPTAPPANGAIIEGSVGLGTTLPGAKLHARTGSAGTAPAWNATTIGILEGVSTGNADLQLFTANNRSAALGFSDPDAIDRGKIAYDHATDVMAFFAAGAERGRVNAAGYWGLGVTDPNSVLDMTGAFTLRGISAPPVSPSDQGRLYYDSAADLLELSVNGGAYSQILTGLTGVPATRTLTTTAPLTIDGGASADLSANRTLAVSDATAGAKGVVQLAGDLAGTAAAPTVVDLTITGEAQGAVLYRNDANWVPLAAGTAGHVLTTAGAGADPGWVAPTGGPPTGAAGGDLAGTYPDPTIGTNKVTDAQLRQGIARSIIGVTGNATANVADIQGATDQVLRVTGTGTALGFGAIDLSKAAAAGGVLQAASFPALTGDVTTVAGALASTIAADAVTNAKNANMAESTIKGRADGAGTGDPTDLTAAQVNTILGTATAAGGWTDDGATVRLTDPNNVVAGATASGGNLTISSTSHATKGKILLGTSAYDEASNRLGIGVAAPVSTLDVEGRVSIGASYSGTSAAPTNGAIIQGIVGIGTNLPQNTLDVAGSAVIGSGYAGALPASTDGLLVEGRVGLGDVGPDNSLDVMSATEAAIAITSTGTNTDALLKFELTDGTALFTVGIDDSDSDKFKISTTALGTSDRLVIDSAGFVGLGRSDPVQRLDVTASGTQIRFGTTAVDSGGYLFSTGAERAGIAGGASFNGTDFIAKATTSSMAYMVSGYFVVATNSGLTAGNAFSPAERFYVDPGGLVGVGRDPTTNPLEVEGAASKTTAGDWAANSDASIKTDVRSIEGALDTVGRLRPVTFRYTDEYRTAHPSLTDTTYYNYIAQEYSRVFPDSVHEGADGLLQMETHSSQVVLVRAVQELHELVKARDAQIAALEKRLAALEHREN